MEYDALSDTSFSRIAGSHLIHLNKKTLDLVPQQKESTE